MDPTCHDGACAKCWGAKYLVFGVVILATAVWWPRYIWHVIGILLVLKGLMKLAKPSCPHCEAMPMKKGKK